MQREREQQHPDVTEQRLIDHLQVAIPLVQRLRVTMQQQARDIDRALTALTKAVETLRADQRRTSEQMTETSQREQPTRTRGRGDDGSGFGDLPLTALRTRRTLREVAHLTGIAEQRLLAIASGEAAASAAERAALGLVIPEWRRPCGGAR